VRSYAVLSEREVSAKKTLDLTNAALTLRNSNQVVEQSDIDVDGKHRGPGYGAPTSEMKTAVRIVARTEGILLDPIYSGKAFGGMLFDARTGSFNSGENILFVMTGGMPGLFAYRSAFED
jgi:D-cysteine desulfhydrase